jgi:hypothetical protein
LFGSLKGKRNSFTQFFFIGYSNYSFLGII